ncbi:dipeptidase [Caballeronia sp. GAWG2-1]|uniref:dipeptidase n=1 Tax=Caballeronia sp. GAWG2-1 TaxID=2921744 RepID=UPI0020277B08|nr:dipeptidase [Caballeronia sp. GAWG2-1]
MTQVTRASHLIVDGLVVAEWSRELFEEMHAGGLSLANCTCSIWENFEGTMRKLGAYKKFLRENDDLIMQVYRLEDVEIARATNRVGVVLGWQNTGGIEDRLEYLQLFHELGVKVMQLTYNTQNWIATGCYESHDGGLSDFGREAIDEMNRLGVLIDLSHVGPKSADDAIRYSKDPVCYTHIAPLALKQHPRNKSDEQLQFIVDRGGFVGVTGFPPFSPKGPAATIDDYVVQIDHVANLLGEDNVGIGTDLAKNLTHELIEYGIRDKGYARQLTRFGEVTYPEGMRSCADYPNFYAAFERRGWSAGRIEKVMGRNWLDFFGRVWK